MKKTERDELRMLCGEPGHTLTLGKIVAAVPGLLDALDAAELATYTLGKELAEAMLKLGEADKRIAELERKLAGYEAKERRVAEAVEVLGINRP